MNKIARKILQSLIPAKLNNYIFYNHPAYKKTYNSFNSFSQEGEDMVLRRLFSNKNNGFFIDIGAHHPSVFSNTNYFYQQGWSGINVEPIQGSKALFDKERPRDTNFELVISDKEGDVEFYLFEPSLLNTMSEQQAVENEKFDWCIPKGSVMIPSMPLYKLLDQHLVPGTKIDLMSIDVEGAEMNVLRSNNWDKYRPDVLLVELIDLDIEETLNTAVHLFLRELDYKFFAKTGNTAFYKQEGIFEF